MVPQHVALFVIREKIAHCMQGSVWKCIKLDTGLNLKLAEHLGLNKQTDV